MQIFHCWTEITHVHFNNAIHRYKSCSSTFVFHKTCDMKHNVKRLLCKIIFDIQIYNVLSRYFLVLSRYCWYHETDVSLIVLTNDLNQQNYKHWIKLQADWSWTYSLWFWNLIITTCLVKYMSNRNSNVLISVIKCYFGR